MDDLFDREQKIYDNAMLHISEMKDGVDCKCEQFEMLAKEYGKLLRQLRRFTKISDRTAENLNASKQDLLDKVHYDALTGIYNRRFMEENLNRIVKTLMRSGNGILSVLMLDIDHFKRYNDTYGHGEGDECLRIIAKTITKSIVRDDDFAARYGGEEFIVILPNTDQAGACKVAERIMENIRDCEIPHENNEVSKFVTISIGVTTGVVSQQQSGADFVRTADKALYASKQNGRDRYTFWEHKYEA